MRTAVQGKVVLKSFKTLEMVNKDFRQRQSKCRKQTYKVSRHSTLQNSQLHYSVAFRSGTETELTVNFFHVPDETNRFSHTVH